jgi:hypothetical protein
VLVAERREPRDVVERHVDAGLPKMLQARVGSAQNRSSPTATASKWLCEVDGLHPPLFLSVRPSIACSVLAAIGGSDTVADASAKRCVVLPQPADLVRADVPFQPPTSAVGTL